MTRRNVATLILMLVLLAPAATSASGSTTIAGKGLINCEISTIHTTRVDCGTLYHTGSERQPAVVPPQNYSSVSLTISWSSYYEEMKLMKIDIYVNPNWAYRGDGYDQEPNCGTILDPRPDCAKYTVQGESPLTLTLPGSAGQGEYVVADVGLADVCGRPDQTTLPCDPVPFRQITDFDFYWTWTLEE